VCIITNQPDTKSNPNPNPTTKQHAIVRIELNTVTCPTYPEKFIRDNLIVIEPFLLLFVTLTTGFSRLEAWDSATGHTCGTIKKVHC